MSEIRPKSALARVGAKIKEKKTHYHLSKTPVISDPFVDMQSRDFCALAKDTHANGQMEAAALYQGMVPDGSIPAGLASDLASKPGASSGRFSF